jgi:hypothetical protein
MELRMKEDIVEASAKNHGMFVVHNETKDQRVVPCWEAISKSTLKTPKEVYDSLAADGYSFVFNFLSVFGLR